MVYTNASIVPIIPIITKLTNQFFTNAKLKIANNNNTPSVDNANYYETLSSSKVDNKIGRRALLDELFVCFPSTMFEW